MILTLLCLLACAEAYLVVVLGDIHGDFDNMIAMLRNNDIIDSRNRWRNTWDKVISVGDLIGRGHQDRRVLEFVFEQQQARPGQWIQLLGNHEIMQLRNDWRYVVDGPTTENWATLADRQRALRRGSRLGDWLRSLPVIHQESGNIFMHAGMADSRNIGRSIGSLNREIGRFLVDNRERQVYNDLVWDRSLIRGAFNDGSCSTIPSILRTFRAERMFVGHTIVGSSSLAGSTQRTPLRMCSGSFYGVDTGISRWQRSRPANLVLDISSSSGRTRSINTAETASVRRRIADSGDNVFDDNFNAAEEELDSEQLPEDFIDAEQLAAGQQAGQSPKEQAAAAEPVYKLTWAWLYLVAALGVSIPVALVAFCVWKKGRVQNDDAYESLIDTPEGSSATSASIVV